MEHLSSLEIEAKLEQMGDFYGLNVTFDTHEVERQLEQHSEDWLPYNPAKPECKRWGLSLTSLDGSLSGGISLGSLRGQSYRKDGLTEMSFRTPTPIWSSVSEVCGQLETLRPVLGRSRFVRLENGGHFPPHRDIGDTFRLIAFFDCDPDSLYLILNGKKIFFNPGTLYYLNKNLEHCVFSFTDKATLLILDVELSSTGLLFVYENLRVR